MKRITNCLLWLLFSIVTFSQESIDTSVLNKIKEEGLNHSQVDRIAHYLIDVSGPRLTNSPGYIKASSWAVSEMKNWGLANVHLDAWGRFGPGWSLQKSYVAIKKPYYQTMIAYPNAWTSGSNGLTSGDVVIIKDLNADSIKKYNYSVKGKVILVRQINTKLPSAFNAFAERLSDDSLTKLNDTYMLTPTFITEVKKRVASMRNAVHELEARGAIALLWNRGMTRDGTVRADAWWSGVKGMFPQLLVVNAIPEDYFRIQRLIDSNVPVQLEMDVVSQKGGDETGYNVIAEIPGTDPQLKNEIVMLGGHLDSWYSGTGATDNGAGSAVMMEVVRILKTLNLKPKRTIRIALWSGEEQGLLGSTGYVRKYFGDPASLKLLPAQSTVSSYFNLDNGTGKIRGVYAQNNEKVQPIFAQWMEPMKDLGVTTVSAKNTGATDHIPFDAVGIPGFQFIQDPIEYETRTHHTNMDVYDHLMIDDLKQAATVVAWFVYNAASRTEKLPRKELPAKGDWPWDNIFK
ncbi:MAG: M20/M25/M40 family metallo-hydrolase [Flavisolibacter sp.]